MAQEESAWLAICVNIGHDRLHLNPVLGVRSLLVSHSSQTSISDKDLSRLKTKQKQKPWKVIKEVT